MEYDINRLKFLDDALMYQMQTNETCVHIPAGISSEEELIVFLKEHLGLPEYCGNSWDALGDVLSYWEDWKILPLQRVVLLHHDMPFLGLHKNGWLDLKNYLEILIESIAAIQERNAAFADPLQHRELVAIFPTQTREEIQTVLQHPPAWEVNIRCLEASIFNEFDPSWSIVEQYLKHLDGLIAEDFTISRQGVGFMRVYYNKHIDAYWVEYRSPDYKVWMLASQKEHSSLSSAGVSFALASHIMETFFAHEERSSSVYWLVNDHFELENMCKHWYSRNEEELLLESTSGMALETIRQGLAEAGYSGEAIFSITYWQDVLSRSDVSLLKRLTALCIIGFSALSEDQALLRPFLHSQVKQERWVSARFLGMQQDEEALPILLSMLTDELPIIGRTSGVGLDEYWYDSWRYYVPMLLRKWPTPEVDKQLRASLIIWLQADSQFDQDIATWKTYEETVCYELGYRGDFLALTNISLDDEHKEYLQRKMKKGYAVKEEHMNYQEEYEYRKK